MNFSAAEAENRNRVEEFSPNKQFYRFSYSGAAFVIGAVLRKFVSNFPPTARGTLRVCICTRLGIIISENLSAY